MRSTFGLALLVFFLSALAYTMTLGPQRWQQPTPDRHFVHLADSYLHGQLAVVGGRPPTGNDWAYYRGQWYVSFPPFPAVLLLPAVWLFGTGLWDRLFWAIFAGLGPALVFVVLRQLVRLGRSQRALKDDLVLSALFGFGTVYYFSAVQGSVWFAAHVVACVLLALYLLCALQGRYPWAAGLCLGLAFLTRPTTLLLGLIFLVEAWTAQRSRKGPGRASQHYRALLVKLSAFALPLLACGLVALILNVARFDEPFVFGHEYLQIRWRPRIERWGLFNYHYLARNLAIFGAALPWHLSEPPFVRISRHGLALWFTTPALLGLLWPRRVDFGYRGMAVAAGAVALLDLCYQNSGWIQFGYRFALDYMVVLIALLACGGRPLGRWFYLGAVFALGVNMFGALTFDRVGRFYDTDRTQRVIFQPD